MLKTKSRGNSGIEIEINRLKGKVRHKAKYDNISSDLVTKVNKK